MRCNRIDLVEGELVRCDGEVKEIPSYEEGVLVLDEVCQKCNQPQFLTPLEFSGTLSV